MYLDIFDPLKKLERNSTDSPMGRESFGFYGKGY